MPAAADGARLVGGGGVLGASEPLPPQAVRNNEVDRTTVLLYRLIKIIYLLRPYLNVPIVLGVAEPKQNLWCANLATVRSKSVLHRLSIVKLCPLK